VNGLASELLLPVSLYNPGKSSVQSDRSSRKMSAARSPKPDQVDELYDELYARYGKILESAHRGEYLAISPQGQTILGPTLRQVAQRAAASFGPGSFLYRIGEPTV